MNSTPIRLISWNVNGIRAVLNKGFKQSLDILNADIIALQETKIQAHQLQDDFQLPGYQSWWSYATVKKGYSGVSVYSSINPETVNYHLGVPDFDNEGRVIELHFRDFIFFNVYFPNGQMSLERLQYKLDFYHHFLGYTDKLKQAGKSLIIVGDYNTAHHEIDLKNPQANEKRSGFLPVEREILTAMEQKGYVDTFRYFYPDTEQYSWWTYRFKAREKNIGWRIDYCWVTRDLIDTGVVKDAFIEHSIYGSDHCPVGLVMELPS